MSKVTDILDYLLMEGEKVDLKTLATKFGIAETTIARYLRRPEVVSLEGFSKVTEDGVVYYSYIEVDEDDVDDVYNSLESPKQLRVLKENFGEGTEQAIDRLMRDKKIHELITKSGTTWYARLTPSSDYLRFKNSTFKRVDENIWEEMSWEEVKSKKWEFA